MKNSNRAVAAARKAKQLPEWLDRDLVRSPYCVTLCTTPAMFLAEQQRIGVLPHLIHEFPKTGAMLSTFDPEDMGDLTCKPALIVTVSASAQKCDPIQVAAMIVHEAVHIVDSMMEKIGERHPSREFRAYSTQAVAQNLMYEYARQTS